MNIDYDHSRNMHTVDGPHSVFRRIFPNILPKSLLDVGCGTGAWLKAALDYEVTDVFGIDGVNIPADKLLIPRERFKTVNLTTPVDLGRRFEFVICLEVAEHLDMEYAQVLLETLTRHADNVLFSAACPGQLGQHHVNCQWPDWWQQRFNQLGYVCDDSLRWQLWNEIKLEPWYRQNVFIARKQPDFASQEPRLRAVIHPEMLPHFTEFTAKKNIIDQIEYGSQPLSWYISVPFLAFWRKIQRKILGIIID